MFERRPMLRAAWSELWPSAVVAVGLAIAIAGAVTIRDQPSSTWLVLVLVPAALHAGVAAGRSPARALAFLLARPCRRDRVLTTRATVALVSLVIAWAIAASALVVRAPHVAVLVELCIFAGLLALAFVCALAASTATDREPLALGIGTLLFASMPAVAVLGAESVSITSGRVFAAHPFGIALVLAIAIVGVGLAVRRSWRECLPVRDRAMVRRLVVGCAGAWVGGQLPCLAIVWDAAGAHGAVPLVLLGSDDRGLIVAGGSPSSVDGVWGPRVDAIKIGDDTIAFDSSRRQALLGGIEAGEITRATARAGVLAVTIVDATDTGELGCRVVVADADRRWIVPDAACDRLALSATGQTLAIGRDHKTLLFDIRDGQSRRHEAKREDRIHRFLGFHGEQPVALDDHRVDHGRPHDRMLRIGVGAAVMPTPVLDASLSGDGDSVALRRANPGTHWVQQIDLAPAHIAVMRLADGDITVTHSVDRQRVRILGWLDPQHLVITSQETEKSPVMLSILSIESGVLVASVIPWRGLAITHVEGPPHGPWLFTRGGSVVEAWSADGGEALWREELATLDRDAPDVQRWVIQDDEVVGIDRRGHWWAHPVPWEVTP